MTDKNDIITQDDGYKTLYLIRHAKSSWDADVISDFDRPLNNRGFKDAPMMAQRLLDKKIIIDNFVSSPALRAKQTALLFRDIYKASANSLILFPTLYHADTSAFFEVITSLDDSLNNVALFSHNPGITYFVNMLTNAVQIDNMPTCGIFAIRVQLKHWANFSVAKKEFLFFDFPKKV